MPQTLAAPRSNGSDVRLLGLSTALALVLVMAVSPVMAQTTQPATPPATTPPAAQPAAPLVTTPAAKPAEEPKKPAPGTPEGAAEEITEVTVTGQRSPNRIDREVYDPKADPDTPTSSAADALNKAPGVAVDPEGNVTLRGNSGVQVLIDGKPSAMLQGDMRAGTLQSMGADDIESIEVMTNPSAQFGAEGTAGVINIVMKRNRKPGGTMSINGAIDSRGGYNGSIGGGYNAGAMSVNGNLFYRHGDSETSSESSRERLNSAGDVTSRSESTGSGKNLSDIIGVGAQWGYNLNDNDSVGIQANFNNRKSDNRSFGTTDDYDAFDVLTSSYVSERTGINEQTNTSLRMDFSHKGDQDGENFKADIRLSQSDRLNDNITTQLYSVGTRPDRRTQRVQDESGENIDISVDYNRRVGDGELAMGLEFDINKNSFDNGQYEVDLLTGDRTLDTINSNSFVLDQDETEAYITYQKPLGDKWIVLAGLRVENTSVTFNQITTRIYRENNYTKIHPSLHLSYLLDDTSKLRFQYSNRVRRPGANDLNPFIVYWDERNARSGNPELLPQTTHSLEGGYEYNKQGQIYTIKMFYQKDEDSFTERSFYLTPDVLLTTRENGGEGQKTGLEFNYNGKVTEKLKLNLRGTVAYNELETTRSGVPYSYDSTAINGQARLDYQLTKKDRVLATFNAQGKELTGQGFREPRYTADMTYSHRFSNKFRLNLRIQDVFDSGENKTITRTETINSESVNRWGGRTFYLSFSFNPFARDSAASDEDGGPRQRGNWGGPRGGGGGPM